MLQSVYDINPARLNAIMPTLQQMEDDPALLERRRRRFAEDVPPPPYSSGHTTQPPTPAPFPPTDLDDVDVEELLRKPLSGAEIHSFEGRVFHYQPSDQYHDEYGRERDRIHREQSRLDENYNRLYRGPNLIGRAGQQRLHIMIRHSIKQRWQSLEVWNPEWQMQNYGGRHWKWDRKDLQQIRHPDIDRRPHHERMATWPSRNEEYPSERAVRLHLERQGGWNEAFDSQLSGTDGPADVHVDDREFLITSRPWFVWKLEVEEERVRLQRDPRNSETYYRARENVTARWKEKGYWKSSWSDLPGWKWKHESPSPEPPDPNDMDFTPSEIDALEAIPPPTPPSPPKPSSLIRQSPTWSNIFGWLPVQDKDTAPPASAQPSPTPHTDGDGDDDDNGPGATAEPVGGELRQRSLDEQTHTIPRAEHGERTSPQRFRRRGEVHGDHTHHDEQQRRPTGQRLICPATLPTCSTTQVEQPSPVAGKTQRGKHASRVLTKSSKISKPSPPTRRSARIAERERHVKGSDIPSKTVKSIDEEDPTPQALKKQSKQMKRQKQKPSTRATTSKKNRSMERRAPTLSKPQGVAKKRGRPRSRRSNAREGK